VAEFKEPEYVRDDAEADDHPDDQHQLACKDLAVIQNARLVQAGSPDEIDIR
jgi:hypothetical protein